MLSCSNLVVVGMYLYTCIYTRPEPVPEPCYPRGRMLSFSQQMCHLHYSIAVEL